MKDSKKEHKSIHQHDPHGANHPLSCVLSHPHKSMAPQTAPELHNGAMAGWHLPTTVPPPATRNPKAARAKNRSPAEPRNREACPFARRTGPRSSSVCAPSSRPWGPGQPSSPAAPGASGASGGAVEGSDDLSKRYLCCSCMTLQNLLRGGELLVKSLH